MKRLNKKGFTLIELLAVIVILAIVVSITIPAITNTINDSKNNSMQVAVNAAQKWMEDQLGIYNTSSSLADQQFRNIIGDLTDENATKEYANTNTALYSALEFDTKDISKIKITRKTDLRFCIEIETITEKSKYFSLTYWNLTNGTATPKTGALNTSTHCN